jgi:hypothetical protein
MSAIPGELEPDTFASRLYDALAPIGQDDSVNGWSLLIYVNAIGVMFQIIEDLVRDTADGPGWSVLMDLDRSPSVALPWLGQFVGVRIPKGFPRPGRTRTHRRYRRLPARHARSPDDRDAGDVDRQPHRAHLGTRRRPERAR